MLSSTVAPVIEVRSRRPKNSGCLSSAQVGVCPDTELPPPKSPQRGGQFSRRMPQPKSRRRKSRCQHICLVVNVVSPVFKQEHHWRRRPPRTSADAPPRIFAICFMMLDKDMWRLLQVALAFVSRNHELHNALTETQRPGTPSDHAWCTKM